MEAITMSPIKAVPCAEPGLTSRSALKIPAYNVQREKLRIPDLSTRNNVSGQMNLLQANSDVLLVKLEF